MNTTIGLVADFVLRQEGMSRARVHHVLIAIQHASDRNVELGGGRGNISGKQMETCFFSTKSTAKSLSTNVDVMKFDVEHFGDFLLTHVQILTADVDFHLTTIVNRLHVACIRFKVKVLLTTHANL